MTELISRKLQRPINPIPESTLTVILITVVVIAALYFGRDVLVPIALAVLLTFVLAPLVRLLQGWYFPRIVAVMIVGLFASAAIFGLGALMVSQVNQLARDLPRYQSTLGDKIQSLQGVAGGTGTLERASEVLKDLSKEINKPNSATSPGPLTENAVPNRPIPVEIKQPDPGALETLAALITPRSRQCPRTSSQAVSLRNSPAAPRRQVGRARAPVGSLSNRRVSFASKSDPSLVDCPCSSRVGSPVPHDFRNRL